MTERERRIRTILAETFAPARLEVVDDSARHAGHAGAAPGGGTHFNVAIVSSAFEGLSRVERHRLVNAALKAEFDGGLHALAVVAKAPAEV